MYIDEKEQALNQILETMYYIENKLIENTFIYKSITRTINNIEYTTSIFNELESLIKDYENVVIKDNK